MTTALQISLLGRILPSRVFLLPDQVAQLLPADAAVSAHLGGTHPTMVLIEALDLTTSHRIDFFGGRRAAVQWRCPIIHCQLSCLYIGRLRHRGLGFWPLRSGRGAGRIFESDRVTVTASLPSDTGARTLFIGELTGLLATRGQ